MQPITKKIRKTRIGNDTVVSTRTTYPNGAVRVEYYVVKPDGTIEDFKIGN